MCPTFFPPSHIPHTFPSPVYTTDYTTGPYNDRIPLTGFVAPVVATPEPVVTISDSLPPP